MQFMGVQYIFASWLFCGMCYASFISSLTGGAELNLRHLSCQETDSSQYEECMTTQSTPTSPILGCSSDAILAKLKDSTQACAKPGGRGQKRCAVPGTNRERPNFCQSCARGFVESGVVDERGNVQCLKQNDGILKKANEICSEYSKHDMCCRISDGEASAEPSLRKDCVTHRVNHDEGTNQISDVEVELGQDDDVPGFFDVRKYSPISCKGDYDDWGNRNCRDKIASLMGLTRLRNTDVECRSEDGNGIEDEDVFGVCECGEGQGLGSDGSCHEWECDQGPGELCKECVPDRELTGNDQCISCNDGYVLDKWQQCMLMDCTEDPDDPAWRGCQECRTPDSIRHQQDCKVCAHGYHFFEEQENWPKQEFLDDGTAAIGPFSDDPYKATGYCYPYTCVAGGNVVDYDPTLPEQSHTYTEEVKMRYRVGKERIVYLTPILSTNHRPGMMHPDKEQFRLPPEEYEFRDHCKTCVPQQQRVQDEHCETCNIGYYLDEMHHSCRRKTCGVPHFRRNAVSCMGVSANANRVYVSKPWSTPCDQCEDDGEECCDLYEPKMTCGAQNVFCHPGTQVDNYFGRECADCEHYGDECCTVMTCDNQHVSCFFHQSRKAGATACSVCNNGGDECCGAKPFTCGLKDVKCAEFQTYKPRSAPCTTCLDGGLECCLPVQKTCSNQNVVCTRGTYDFDETTTCIDCRPDSPECCKPMTCGNQGIMCDANRARRADVRCSHGTCYHNSDVCCGPPSILHTCGNNHVMCYHNLYRPRDTPCDPSTTCRDYGETCCSPRTCHNQGVVCSNSQVLLDGECDDCVNYGWECCKSARTCGNMGVQCKLEQVPRSSTTRCNTCAHFAEGEDECCGPYSPTCGNQGVVCLPGTHKPLDTSCEGRCRNYGDQCCDATTCGNQRVACSEGRAYLERDTICGDSCVHDSDLCCAPKLMTCHNMGVRCYDGLYLDQQAICGPDRCTNDEEPCCQPYTKTCANQNVKCGRLQTYKAGSTPCDATGETCDDYGSTCCESRDKTCGNQNVECRPGYYRKGWREIKCGSHDDSDEAKCIPHGEICCEEYKKTCRNQGVICGYGLEIRARDVQMHKSGDPACEECDHYGAECCTPVTKTCGNQGVRCSDGLYLPSGTVCGDQCIDYGSPCCMPLKPTCLNTKFVCDSGHYKPGTIRCKTLQCSVEECCHTDPPTCGNQNVKCVDGLYRKSNTPCVACDNYADECCEPVTCSSKNVECDARFNLGKVDNYSTKVCYGCDNNSVDECCKHLGTGIKDPTCLNKYGVDEKDIVNWPFLANFKKTVVYCDVSKGYHYIVDGGGNRLDSICSNPSNSAQGNDHSICNDNDLNCCWRKTCKKQIARVTMNVNYVGSNGINFNGDSVVCPNNMQLKPNAEYIVCQGDCISDCCDSVPDKETCATARVGCGYGYEQRDDYHTSDCETTDSCVFNSIVCCQATTCRNVLCSKGFTKRPDATTCVNCIADSSECCVPDRPSMTCSEQRVSCGYGLYRIGSYYDHVCFPPGGVDACADNILFTEGGCCVRKTCAKTDLLSFVSCTGNFQNRLSFDVAECDACISNGAECCEPRIPHSTCRNQDVECTLGFFHLDLDGRCDDCITNGSECCQQRTCGNVDGSNAFDSCPTGYSQVGGETTCTLCNVVECCVKDYVATCWSEGKVCPDNTYAKHPTTICPGGEGSCTEEICCEEKTCKNQNVCCNKKLGFVQKDDFADRQCSRCADNCEDCCESVTPTCGSVKVGCGFGWYQKQGVKDVQCSTCTLNDIECCRPMTCGENPFSDHRAVLCPADTHDAQPGETRCHFCGTAECCKPKVMKRTCMSERVGCGLGFRPILSNQLKECTTCALNDEVCCQSTTCAMVTCDTGYKLRGDDVLCGFCDPDACCVEQRTCKSMGVACGYGFQPKVGTDMTACTTCRMNDMACCQAKTCERNGIECREDLGYRLVDNPGKQCAFCGRQECCVAVQPKRTCSSEGVACTHGFSHILGSANLECGSCQDNSPTCCSENFCADKVSCPGPDLESKPGVKRCGFCDVEECCQPVSQPPSCFSARVSCGFGFGYRPDPKTRLCSSCTQNDSQCCVEKTCGTDGPSCEEHTMEHFDTNGRVSLKYLTKAPDTRCHFCTLEECCDFPQLPKTCGNQKVVCAGIMSPVLDFSILSCNDCVNNGEECCEERTCAAHGVDCNENLYSRVVDYATKTCLACANNGSECCEPKICGNFPTTCPSGQGSLAKNTPCVSCDVADCCEDPKDFKCAEIIIPNGQAFYTEPNGPGSSRTRGSVLFVECDLGFKFEHFEYEFGLDGTSSNGVTVDYPVCDPIHEEKFSATHVEIFSPETSGWNRAPPMCRPVTCPILEVTSLYTPNAENIGRVVYRDAQMDTLPLRGAGFGPRDYAAEADVVCAEGFIRVPNTKCVSDPGQQIGGTNTLEFGLKGYWKMDGDIQDFSPHCLESRTANSVGTCNDGVGNGDFSYQTGPMIDGKPGKSVRFEDKGYIEILDGNNPNWGLGGLSNQLDIHGNEWTASLWVYLDNETEEQDGFLFTRYTEDKEEVVSIKLNDEFVEVQYNHKRTNPRGSRRLSRGVWHSVIVRLLDGQVDLWVNGVLDAHDDRDDDIWDTSSGSIYLGVDAETPGDLSQFLDGRLDEVRWYQRGLTDAEVFCLAEGFTKCSTGKFYAKPYNTQGCNRDSETIQTAEECESAIDELLLDGRLGNSLNGGVRFGKTIVDKMLRGSINTPTKCSYREADNQMIFNPNSNGRGHTSLAPICHSHPQNEEDLSTIGCLPKCLENGEWSQDLPTCEKDWCNPIFEEWHCCDNRATYTYKGDVRDKNYGRKFLEMDYYRKHHGIQLAKCPVGYGDCDHDGECHGSDSRDAYCSQKRDLDRIDICIEDIDPCDEAFGDDRYSSGIGCVVLQAVGIKYEQHVTEKFVTPLVIGVSFIFLGGAVGYYLCADTKRQEDYKPLLEEEL